MFLEERSPSKPLKGEGLVNGLCRKGFGYVPSGKQQGKSTTDGGEHTPLMER